MMRRKLMLSVMVVFMVLAFSLTALSAPTRICDHSLGTTEEEFMCWELDICGIGECVAIYSGYLVTCNHCGDSWEEARYSEHHVRGCTKSNM